MDGCPDCAKRKALTEEQDALWPLQGWLRKNSAIIIEPHLNHFKDSLSCLSNKITKQDDRFENIEDMIRKLEEAKLGLERRVAAIEKKEE